MASLWNDDELIAHTLRKNADDYAKQQQLVSDNYDKTWGKGGELNFGPLQGLVQFLSGNGGSKQGYMDKRGFTKENNAMGANGLISGENALAQAIDFDKQLGKDYQSGVGAVRGLKDIPLAGGILYELLAPVAQTAAAGRDLGSGVTGDWTNWNNRDHLSDLGAAAETGLNLMTGGTLGSGASLGAKAGKMALTSAASGAASTLREHGSNATMGDIASNAALSGAIGGAIPVVGAGLGKVGNSLAKRGVANGAAATASKASQIGQGIKSFIPKTKLGKGAALAAGAGGAIGLGNLLGNGGQQNDVYSGYNNYGGY